MSPGLEGRRCLVTGASGGIGAAIAEALGRAGAEVFAHYRHDRQACEAVVATIRAGGGAAHAIGADLSEEDACFRLFDRIEARGRPVDILVNAAGTYPTAPLLGLSLADWRAMFAANLDSAFLCTRRMALGLVGRPGAIVNIASLSAHVPAPAHSHYNSSKAALVAFSRSAAQELGPLGIRVNSLSPGLTARPGLETDWPEGFTAWQARAPLGRLVQPENIAAACLFLASDAAAAIAGQDLVIDAGMMVAAHL